MVFEMLGHRLRILHMTFHAQRQGLDAGYGEKGVERRHRRAEVAQADGVALHGKSKVAEGLVETQAVIGRFGLTQSFELVVLRPIELAAVNDDAPHRVAMTRKEFRGGM